VRTRAHGIIKAAAIAAGEKRASAQKKPRAKNIISPRRRSMTHGSIALQNCARDRLRHLHALAPAQHPASARFASKLAQNIDIN